MLPTTRPGFGSNPDFKSLGLQTLCILNLLPLVIISRPPINFFAILRGGPGLLTGERGSEARAVAGGWN
jgi:hypothetical protein